LIQNLQFLCSSFTTIPITTKPRIVTNTTYKIIHGSAMAIRKPISDPTENSFTRTTDVGEDFQTVNIPEF